MASNNNDQVIEKLQESLYTLSKQVGLLYEEHIYSIEHSSVDEDTPKNNPLGGIEKPTRKKKRHGTILPQFVPLALDATGMVQKSKTLMHPGTELSQNLDLISKDRY